MDTETRQSPHARPDCYPAHCAPGAPCPRHIQAEAAAALAATPTHELLTKAYALTHRIHECRGAKVAGQCDGPCTDARAARDLIDAEVERRAHAADLFDALDGRLMMVAEGTWSAAQLIDYAADLVTLARRTGGE